MATHANKLRTTVACARDGCPVRFRPRWKQRYCSHVCANQANARVQAPPTDSMTIRQIAARYHYSYIGVWCIIHRLRKLRGAWEGRQYLVKVADVEAAERRGVFRHGRTKESVR